MFKLKPEEISSQVVAGLILVVLLNVAGFIKGFSYFRREIWNLPWWVFWPLVFLALVGLLSLIFRPKRDPKKKKDPDYFKCKRDVFEGMVVEWGYKYEGELLSLVSVYFYCPKDGMELRELFPKIMTTMNCHKCKTDYFEGSTDSFSGVGELARRELSRRVRTGEWKGAKKRLKILKEEVK